MRHRPGEAANVFGTRMHDILQGVTESVRFNAPGEATNRILTEVIIDKSGTITAFGGKPGGALVESATVDVAILNKGVSSTDAIVGRKAKDVLTAGIDYKTGDARLARHQREFFEKIDKPLQAVGGNLAEEMLGGNRLPRARPYLGWPVRPRPGRLHHPGAGRHDRAGRSARPAAGAAHGRGAVRAGRGPDRHRDPVPDGRPMEAKDHGDTAIPIICIFAPEACLWVGAGLVVGAVGVASEQAAEEELQEVGQATVNGLFHIYGGIRRGHATDTS